MSDGARDSIAEGRAALRAGDAAAARRAFEAAADAPAGDVLEGFARCAYLEVDFRRSVDGFERAYAAHREAGDQGGAVRAARTVAYMHGSVFGDHAVMKGWIARAQTLLVDDPDPVESGWVALNVGMFASDRATKDARFREALACARAGGDADLEFVALAYLGANLVYGDRAEEGMVLLDEALAAVAGFDVDDFCALQEIFCQLFSACERAHDVARADQWIRVGEAIARRRRLPAVSAFCRTHYGGVLTAAGRWPEADETLTEAVRLWGLGHRFLRSGALVRLAELRVRQGRLEEAEQLLDGLDADVEAARPLAVIQLARGETARAADTLSRALDQIDADGTEAVPLLALLVDVHLASGDVDRAAAAAGALEVAAARHEVPYVAACAALARGQVLVAAGGGDPRASLHSALADFGRAQMPMEMASAHLALANALVADQPDMAIAEARTALGAFERLQAARHADEAAALLRSLGTRPVTGGRGDGLLTKREAEVLELLGHGLSNPEIADRLYISRKTAEHHVGRVLAKLGLRSRAEAAAYAARVPGAAAKPGDG